MYEYHDGNQTSLIQVGLNFHTAGDKLNVSCYSFKKKYEHIKILNILVCMKTILNIIKP
jgi:hypothetical protein